MPIDALKALEFLVDLIAKEPAYARYRSKSLFIPNDL